MHVQLSLLGAVLAEVEMPTDSHTSMAFKMALEKITVTVVTHCYYMHSDISSSPYAQQ